MANNTAVLQATADTYKARTGAPKFGRVAFNGNGSATAFNIAHGLGATPKRKWIEARSDDARPVRTITADGTNITVTFAAPPGAGTNNVKIEWGAHAL
jgi:hypothetical protein